MIKVRIIPGDFGKYTTNGGSWDPDKPEVGTFKAELQMPPIKGSAILYTGGGGLQVISHVQEVVVGEHCVFVFAPASTTIVVGDSE
jgi:hypothetical protein